MTVLPMRERERALYGNVVDYLLEASSSRGHGGRAAIVAPDRVWTYGDLNERIGRTANGLKSLGVGAGDRVLFSAVDSIDFPTLFLAIMKIGGVALHINTYLKPHDYQYFIADSDAHVVIVDHLLIPVIAQIRNAIPSVRHVVSLRSVVPGYPLLDEIIANEPIEC